MKKYLAQLRPMERRLVVGVAVMFLLVLNWVFIWPHFDDWGKLQLRLTKAKSDLARDQQAVAQIPALQAQVKAIEGASDSVPLEDQGISFLRTVQSQSAQSGVAIVNTSRQLTRTNDTFFVEQVQNLTASATDDQLVDFLYKLGSGSSMIRVRDLELQPDPSHQKLNANIKLVASYQKNLKSATDAKSSTAKAK